MSAESKPLTHGEFAQIVATAFLQGLQWSMQQPDESALRARGASMVVQDAAKDYAKRVLRVWAPKLRKDQQ